MCIRGQLLPPPTPPPPPCPPYCPPRSSCHRFTRFRRVVGDHLHARSVPTKKPCKRHAAHAHVHRLQTVQLAQTHVSELAVSSALYSDGDTFTNIGVLACYRRDAQLQLGPLRLLCVCRTLSSAHGICGCSDTLQCARVTSSGMTETKAQKRGI